MNKRRQIDSGVHLQGYGHGKGLFFGSSSQKFQRISFGQIICSDVSLAAWVPMLSLMHPVKIKTTNIRIIVLPFALDVSDIRGWISESANSMPQEDKGGRWQTKHLVRFRIVPVGGVLDCCWRTRPSLFHVPHVQYSTHGCVKCQARRFRSKDSLRQNEDKLIYGTDVDSPTVR